MGLFYFFLFFLENYLLGAFFLTLPAVGAFGRIDVSDIILHGNRIEFTYFLTHFAQRTICHTNDIAGYDLILVVASPTGRAIVCVASNREPYVIPTISLDTI